jgi:chaperone modulatory protein CbpM
MKQSMSQLLTGVVLDDELLFSLRELCQLCRVDAESITAMVEEWRFPGASVRRVQIVLRLQRDLRVNLPGAALVLDLLEELEELRRLHRQHGGM